MSSAKKEGGGGRRRFDNGELRKWCRKTTARWIWGRTRTS